MSHHPERTDKNCLNCGATVAGRFCQHCGQENVPSHMPFFALVQHFVYDIFHFDGKFFDTLRYLFFKPGFVASQYVGGKRASYLEPIRMYLFTSAFFFLLFAAFGKPQRIDLTGRLDYLTRTERMELAMEVASKAQANALSTADSNVLWPLLDSTQRVKLLPADSSVPQQGKQVTFRGARYVLLSEPDSGRFQSISDSTTWLGRSITRRLQYLYDKYQDNPGEGIARLWDSFWHRMPYLLFVSLPFFAAILKLLYIRRRTYFYYDHAVFTLYHYIFSFILLLFILGSISLQQKLGWSGLNLLISVLFICWPVHLLFAMKRFYLQGWGRTLAKFVLLNVMGTTVLLLLFFIFLLFSFYTL